MHDEIEIAAQQAFTNIPCKDTFLRHLPKRIVQVLVAERFVKRIIDFDLRMGGAESFTYLVRLNSGQVTATRRDRHAHKSSHPKGRNCACWDWRATNRLISARAASTCPANLSRSMRNAANSSCRGITIGCEVTGSDAASPRRSRHFVNDTLCVCDQRATSPDVKGAAMTNPASGSCQATSAF